MLVILALATAGGCNLEDGPPRSRPPVAERAGGASRTESPSSRTPRGDRALWELQDHLATTGAPLRTGERLAAGETRADVAPVEVRLDPAGPTWTARLARCETPRASDCAGDWEDGVCECTLLVLDAGDETRSLVIAESSALGRVRLEALARPGGANGLWLATDMYDRSSPWPRVGFLVEGPAPRLVWRGPLGSCEFEVRGDPEDERAPTVCTPPELGARYSPADELVVDATAGPRTFTPARRP